MRCSRCGKELKDWESFGTGSRWANDYVEIVIEPVRKTKIGYMNKGRGLKKEVYEECDNLCRDCTESYLRWFDDGKMCAMRKIDKYRGRRFIL